MQKTPTTLILSLMLVSGVVGFGAGYSFTPEYRLSMYDVAGMDLGRADRWVDLRYVNAMIAHHRAAMQLAEQAVSSERPEVRELSQSILSEEPTAIAELYSYKEDWYGDARTVRDPVAVRLGEYDETFDLRFLNALIAHHEEGLRMTTDIRAKTSRATVLDNANKVDAFLTSTLVTLKSWRTTWYAVQ
ncbi:MAG: DUF305 domain-containing protein [Candidatus Pacebacteria bacterium]|nr:DUF305 domain-containing protein [Candidatus Paceibacterota bacterium]